MPSNLSHTTCDVNPKGGPGDAANSSSSYLVAAESNTASPPRGRSASLLGNLVSAGRRALHYSSSKLAARGGTSRSTSALDEEDAAFDAIGEHFPCGVLSPKMHCSYLGSGRLIGSETASCKDNSDENLNSGNVNDACDKGIVLETQGDSRIESAIVPEVADVIDTSWGSDEVRPKVLFELVLPYSADWAHVFATRLREQTAAVGIPLFDGDCVRVTDKLGTELQPQAADPTSDQFPLTAKYLSCKLSSLRHPRASDVMANPMESSARGAQVFINLYDLSAMTSFLNQTILSHRDVPLFHCGVEAYDQEYSFQYIPDGKDTRKSTGVLQNKPRCMKLYSFCETLEIGWTSFSKADVKQIVRKLCYDWRACTYHLTRRNCLTFAEDLVGKLGLPFPPRLIAACEELNNSSILGAMADGTWSLAKWWMNTKALVPSWGTFAPPTCGIPGNQGCGRTCTEHRWAHEEVIVETTSSAYPGICSSSSFGTGMKSQWRDSTSSTDEEMLMHMRSCGNDDSVPTSLFDDIGLRDYGSHRGFH